MEIMWTRSNTGSRFPFPIDKIQTNTYFSGRNKIILLRNMIKIYLTKGNYDSGNRELENE